MSSASLWQIVLKETFLSPDVFVLLIVPVLGAVIAILMYKKSPLSSAEGWYHVGQRFLILGNIFVGLTLIIYLLAILFSYSNKPHANALYTGSLQRHFQNYYSSKKDYTQRLIDFAQRIENTKAIHEKLDAFAIGLEGNERVELGRVWSASRHGGRSIQSGTAFNELGEELYWTKDKIAQYKKKYGKYPATSDIRYTEEQIDEFKEGNWSKLYPMLRKDQWIFITNQILTFKNREDVFGFLRNVADCFKDDQGKPTESLNGLYEALANKACPTDAQKIECYLEDSPKLLAFYKFSLQNRWWFRTVALAIIFTIIGFAVILKGKSIAKNGKKKIFK